MTTLINQNPIIYEASAGHSTREWREEDDDENSADAIDAQEIFAPPVIGAVDHIQVSDENNSILVEFTPTIPHCSMATLIGLCIRVRLLRCLPSRFKVDISVRKGTHQSEHAVNKQLNDKERVAAALENSHLLEVVNQCLATATSGGVVANIVKGPAIAN
ncbi:Mitotic spindle-associated MMXD complex subunit MIP18 [Linnemannia elongata]|nr:Mitotic spindle-associated MMXD complex subunit MIP18 [Linnemannia elongata]